MDNKKLVVITTVRNGIEYLEKYFENVEQFADGIIFLDDGSTDETYDIIKEHPLTKHIIRNPKRDTIKGWDQSENISKLNDYVKKNMRDYDWVLLMDIDMLIHPPYRIKDLMNFEYNGAPHENTDLDMEKKLDKKYKKIPNNENAIEVDGKVILSFDPRYKEYLKWRDENPDLEQQLIDDLEHGDFCFSFHLYASSSDEHGYLPIKGNIKCPFSPQHQFRMWKNKSHYTILPVQGSTSTGCKVHGQEYPSEIYFYFSSGCFVIHRGSATYSRRAKRYQKYTIEVDPDKKKTYEYLYPDHSQYDVTQVKL